MRRVIGLLVFAAAFLAAAASPPGLGTSRADALDGLELLGNFQVTYYWMAEEDARYALAVRSVALLDVDDREIARVSPAYRRVLDREGTGRLADGRVVNVALRRGDGFRYVELGRDSWGLGVDRIPLQPWRSVAADPSRLPRGSLLFLPALATLMLGSGERHGGSFVVDDVGSAIRNNRIDVFIGEERELQRVELLLPSHATTPVYRRRANPIDLLTP